MLPLSYAAPQSSGVFDDQSLANARNDSTQASLKNKLPCGRFYSVTSLVKQSTIQEALFRFLKTSAPDCAMILIPAQLYLSFNQIRRFHL